MALSVPDQLAQLEAARQIVLADAGLYPQIVQGILPIVGANSRLELRRWGAEFLAETFASPTFASKPKENSAVGVLQILQDLLEKPGEDAAVVKSVVQTAASIYSLVFHYMYVHSLFPYRRQSRRTMGLWGSRAMRSYIFLFSVLQTPTTCQSGIRLPRSNRIY